MFKSRSNLVSLKWNYCRLDWVLRALMYLIRWAAAKPYSANVNISYIFVAAALLAHILNGISVLPIGKGLPDPGTPEEVIPTAELPTCQSCGGLLRPHIVWFGESLEDKVLDAAFKELDNCDLCLVVGTSSIVYPAAMFAPQVNNLLLCNVVSSWCHFEAKCRPINKLIAALVNAIDALSKPFNFILMP